MQTFPEHVRSAYRLLVESGSMPQLVTYGSELLRINAQKNSIEYSSNGGRTWLNRFCMSSVGTFRDLLVMGTEVFAATSKGLYWFRNSGATVSIRLRTTCIIDSKLKATCSSWPKLGQVDSTWFVLPTCLAGVHGELHGCSRSRVSGAGYPPSIHVD